MKILRLLVVGFFLIAFMSPLQAAEKLKALLIDGQNNHDWRRTTPILKWALEESGRFTVDVSTAPPSPPRGPQAPKKDATEQQKADYEAAQKKWNEEKAALEQANKELWLQWRPKFSDYAVVVSNYNGDLWPDEVRTAFVDYVRGGGGFVSVHAADNAFPNWPEYNEIIGLGGWGGRNEKSGPYVRFRDGKEMRDESPGGGGGHGSYHEFVVEVRDANHPITKGLPQKWKHGPDELYHRLRGPAKNMTVLVTAFSDPKTGGTGDDEPMMMVIQFGKGRSFHTALGHGLESVKSLGFQSTLARGAEWVATGKVTLPAPKPEEIPADKSILREPPKQ